MPTLPAFCRMAERTRVVRTGVAASALLVCQAATAAVIAFTGGGTTTDFPNRTLGYQFTTGSSGLLVSTLGYWDESGDGLAEAHQVGIWTDRDRTLVALATVTAGTTAWLDDGFRYVDIADVLLAPDTSYLIGGYTGVAGTDAVIRLTTATAGSGVTLGSSRFDPRPFCGFCAPTGTQDDRFDDGYFGPNMNGALAATALPEPGSLALVGLAFAALAGARPRPVIGRSGAGAA